MALAYNVAGPVLVRIEVAGQNLASLGFSEDGMRVQIQEFSQPVKTDVAADAPAEFQAMGAVAHITGRMVAFDDAEAMKLKARMLGSNTNTDGTYGVLGTLYNAGNLAHRLILVGTSKIFRFNSARLEGMFDTKIGTKYTVYDMRWLAWAPIAATATTPNGAVLYDHTNS